MTGELAAFLGVAAVVICTPGPDTALTIRNSLSGGRRGGIATAAGVALGQATWTVAAAAGIASLIAASRPAFLVLQLAGAVYLVVLGLQTVVRALRGRMGHLDLGRAPGPPPRRALRQGLLSNLANPKMAVFFTSLLPQFAPESGASFAILLGLGLIFSLATLTWLSLYSMGVARLRHLLARDRIRRALEAATGAVLLGFGIRLAVVRA